MTLEVYGMYVYIKSEPQQFYPVFKAIAEIELGS
jgi:hypothetical protein